MTGSSRSGVTFLHAVESCDPNNMLALCASDAVFEWPLVPGRITDFETFRARVGSALAPMKGLTFTDIEIDPMLDPNAVVFRYRGTATMATTGKEYRQTYLVQMCFRDDKVILFREYYDKVALADALQAGE